jgi:hypothetical protein
MINYKIKFVVVSEWCVGKEMGGGRVEERERERERGM